MTRKIYGISFDPMDDWESRVLNEIKDSAKEKFVAENNDNGMGRVDFIINKSDGITKEKKEEKEDIMQNSKLSYLYEESSTYEFVHVTPLDLVSCQNTDVLFLGKTDMDEYIQITEDLIRYDMKYYLFINHIAFCDNHLRCRQCDGCDYEKIEVFSRLINNSRRTFFDRSQRMDLWLKMVPFIDENKVKPFRVQHMEEIV